MQQRTYLELLDELSTFFTPAELHLLRSANTLTLKQRKAIAYICRSQTSPDYGTNMYNKLSSSLSDQHIKMYYNLAKDSLSAGLLYTLLKFAPMDDDTIELALKQSYMKEYDVLTSKRRYSEIIYDNLFKDNGFSIHDDLPYNKIMINKHILNLNRWLNILNDVTLYPKFSDKTCSRDTTRIANYYNLIDDQTILKLSDIELIYHDTGIKLEGECEMRQVWLPSNLVPRTYYCMGGLAYHRSKYMQQAFSLLLELFEPTSKYLCVQPTRIQLKDDEYGYIYDLESFTSNLHEQVHYLNNLALYCRDHMVKIMDSYYGLIEVNFSELISDFASLHCDILVSIERLKKYSINDTIYIEQNVAGLLGIYGNIMSAKWLHGVVMSQLIENEDQLNVAGDDGLKATDNNVQPYAAIKILGKMMEDKSDITTSLGAVCLKRPILQVGTRILQGNLINWPSFDYPSISSEIDFRYQKVRRQSNFDRKSSTASTITTFLKDIQYMDIKDYKMIIEVYLNYLYKCSNLLVGGNVPQISNRGFFTPFIQYGFLNKNPIHYTISLHYNGIAKVQSRGYLKFEQCMLENNTFTCNSNKYLNTLRRLGYLQDKINHIMVYGNDGYSKLLNEYLGNDPIIYTYTILKSIPDKFLLSY